LADALAIRTMSATHALSEITAPFVAEFQAAAAERDGPLRAVFHPYLFAKLLLLGGSPFRELGLLPSCRLAFLNDFLSCAAQANWEEYVHVGAVFPNDHSLELRVLDKTDDLFSEGRQLYQAHLPRFRGSDTGDIVTAAQFLAAYHKDMQPYGMMNTDTWCLGEYLCLAADGWLGSSACELYISTRRIILDTLLGAEARKYGRGKRLATFEKERRDGSTHEVETIKSNRRVAAPRTETTAVIVAEWAALHQRELLAKWGLLEANRAPAKIKPLDD
jgi:hypothetical protein